MILRTERNRRTAGVTAVSIEFESLGPKRTQLNSLFMGFSVLTLLVSGLSGCAPSTEDEMSSGATIESAPTATPPATSDRSVAQEATFTCEPSQRDALQRPISEQLLALHRGDFAAARDQASPSFRAIFDTQGFEEMIRLGFPFLLDQSSVAFGRCGIEGETGSLEVRFDEGSPIALLYFFVKTQGRWWINGASPASDAVTGKVETS
jgi:hypothetical protein